MRLWYRKTSIVVTAWPLATPADQQSFQSPPQQVAEIPPSTSPPSPPHAYPRATAQPYDAGVFAPSGATQSLGQYGSATGR